jgi:hypothetical protein
MVLLVRAAPTEQVLAWALPGIGVHAALALYQGIAHLGERASGIAANANIAAGLLILGVATLAPTRYRYWAFPLLLALIFTGSRLGLIVAVSLLIGVGIRHSWRFVLRAIGVMALTAVLFFPAVQVVFRKGNAIRLDAVSRVSPSRLAAVPQVSPSNVSPPRVGLPGVLPAGYAGDFGLHNVPLRLWVELGALGSLVWAGMSLWGLTRRLWTPAWWCLLALVGLSTLDYYTWVPLSVSAFWWLAIRLQDQPSHLLRAK